MTIHVLTHDLPHLLYDIIAHAISSKPDMELLRDAEMLPRTDDGARAVPDVIIVGTAKNGDLTKVGRLLEHTPHAAVFAIEADGRRVSLCELRPHCIALGELSPGELVRLIRCKASGLPIDFRSDTR